MNYSISKLNTLGLGIAVLAGVLSVEAAPVVSRLTPPSALFTFGDGGEPYIARFLPGQRFDLEATVQPDSGKTITSATFKVDGVTVPGTVTSRAATVSGLAASTSIFSLRAFSKLQPGVHTFTVTAVQSDSLTVTATGNFEILDVPAAERQLTAGGGEPDTSVSLPAQFKGPRFSHLSTARKIQALEDYIDSGAFRRQSAAVQNELVRMLLSLTEPNTLPAPSVPAGAAKNIIIFIGDGMGIAHRTAARIVLNGVQQGKANAPLAMDKLPYTALVNTASLNSIITDSSPGAACYSTGNKANNNQQGVFPDDTLDKFDNPRVELIGEYLWRTQQKSLGIVTTADVFDATPGAFGTHTQDRGAGTGICDQYLDEAAAGGLKVLMGGGRKWFLPNTTSGSARGSSTDYVLPSDLASAWGVPTGASDPGRNLLADFQSAGFSYAPDANTLTNLSSGTTKLLGLFSFSNMNVSKDKIDKRRNPGSPGIVDDYGFPDQPMLDEMTDAALKVLSKNENGFVLMVEGASIDKQAHNMDTERWILETIEFDRAIQKAVNFAQSHPDTLIVVTADHECSGANIIGASLLSNSSLTTLSTGGGGSATLRDTVVGIYDAASFPSYAISADGFPTSMDPNYKVLIGYAANADRYEDWLTNAKPLRDSQQPFNGSSPLNTYPNGPLNRDTAGNYLITGQVPGTTAVHTGSDIPLSAYGTGASQFHGVMDNTEVFFRVMRSAFGQTTD
ncbi:MAG TPA: alkaline phosphatase [Roseimicrobium sp.]|nr:alkaline phosphatase [Roseimicrobium sp.]